MLSISLATPLLFILYYALCCISYPSEAKKAELDARGVSLHHVHDRDGANPSLSLASFTNALRFVGDAAPATHAVLTLLPHPCTPNRSTSSHFLGKIVTFEDACHLFTCAGAHSTNNTTDGGRGTLPVGTFCRFMADRCFEDSSCSDEKA